MKKSRRAVAFIKGKLITITNFPGMPTSAERRLNCAGRECCLQTELGLACLFMVEEFVYA